MNTATAIKENTMEITQQISRSQQAVERLGRSEYMRRYQAGWRHSQTANASLDNNRFNGDEGWAWEDGYLDNAGDRKKWHRRDCPLDDHNECSGWGAN